MLMRHWDPDRPLVRNRYGIEEPDSSSERAENLDLLLIPLVGWSVSGYRLGMGGGYFDRMLASFPARCWRVGVAYDCQRDDALDLLREDWDEDLDAVLTESGLWSAGAIPVSAGR
jgi:5-formyltetrahydrofolate cyclo-ligase